MTAVPSQYVDEYGHHFGFCNACGEEAELGQDCDECINGEVVPYDDDFDPDDQYRDAESGPT